MWMSPGRTLAVGNSRASRGCKDSCSQNSCDGCDGHVTDVKTTKARFEKCGKILEKQTVANGSLEYFGDLNRFMGRDAKHFR
jgi:hypothetical protein